MNQNADMDEKEFISDVLYSQKHITETYNAFANECSAPTVRDTFMYLLEEEHQMQAEIFSEMQKRGWYQPEQAQQQKIEQAKRKYQMQSTAQGN